MGSNCICDLLSRAREKEGKGLSFSSEMVSMVRYDSQYFCVYRVTLCSSIDFHFSREYCSLKDSPQEAFEDAKTTAELNTLKLFLEDSCNRSTIEKEAPPVSESAPEKPKEKEKPKEAEPQKEDWNPKDVAELKALRELLDLTQSKLGPYVKEWSRGLWDSAKDITQENIKAFNKFMTRKASEVKGEDVVREAVSKALQEG